MNQLFLEKLHGIVTEDRIKQKEPMERHTTFRIGGAADVYVQPERKELGQVIRCARECQIPVTIVGHGSNMLVRDGGIRGAVIEIGSAMSGIEMLDQGRMKILAGTLLSRVAQEAAAAGLTGFEFAAGIPGTMGGALVMNAGAYGGEMKDVVESATVLTPDGQEQCIPVEALDLSYRHSCILGQGYLVLDVTIQLQPGDEQQIRQTMADLRSRRLEKQPLEYPSAGSTFKRPTGYFAGKLIADAGMQGYAVGDAQVSEKHAGFVINRGHATAADVEQLMKDVHQKVLEQFGVELEPEVKIIGEKA